MAAKKPMKDEPMKGKMPMPMKKGAKKPPMKKGKKY